MNKKILEKYDIRAKKSLWQNFLINEEKLKFISNFLDLEDKNIVEVWPGYGALTEKILEKKPKNLDLVELDKDMINILNKRIEEKDFNLENTKISIKNIDVLKYKSDFEKYFVIANIPYYITSPILRHFFYDVKNTPESMIILMQKDVGDKILEWTEKNQKKFKNSVLSLFLQKKSYIKEILYVPKEDFFPSPKVNSSVLFFEKHNLYDEINDKLFLDFIKLAFSENRKKLSKNLAKKYKKEDVLDIFKKNKIWENTRAEELDIALYCKLTWVFNNILNK